MNGSRSLYFEDIEVGATSETKSVETIEAHMVSFAQEWDPMPIHVDRDAAAASIFGGITASSVYTFGLKQLLVKQIFDERSVVCMLGFTEGRLPVALHAGRRVRLVATWLDKRPSNSQPDCGIVRFAIRLETDRDEVVLDYIETVLIRRRGPAAAL